MKTDMSNWKMALQITFKCQQDFDMCCKLSFVPVAYVYKTQKSNHIWSWSPELQISLYVYDFVGFLTKVVVKIIMQYSKMV